MPEIKRLFFDIETSPNIGVIWRPGYKVRITPDNIIHERAIICSCYKWQGEKEVHSVTWDKKQNDKRVVATMAKLFAEADEIVAHNGDKFDIAWLRGRALQHGISFPPRIVSQDTYKLSKRLFNFNSHRLDYLANLLVGSGKLPTGGLDLWKAVLLDKDDKALARMVAYCKQDVAILEQVWDKMQAYVPAKSHATGVPSECPECGSDSTHVHKRRTTASGYRKIQYQCLDCGKYHTVAASRYEKSAAK